jgi:hypothetical protein
MAANGSSRAKTSRSQNCGRCRGSRGHQTTDYGGNCGQKEKTSFLTSFSNPFAYWLVVASFFFHYELFSMKIFQVILYLFFFYIYLFIN